MADNNNDANNTDSTAHCIWQFADVEYNTERMELSVAGDVQRRFSGQRRMLLEIFLENQNQLIRNDDLISRIWPEKPHDRDKSNLIGLVGRLNETLGPKAKELIDGTDSAGYKFAGAKRLPLPDREDMAPEQFHPRDAASPNRGRILAGVAVCVALAALWMAARIRG